MKLKSIPTILAASLVTSAAAFPPRLSLRPRCLGGERSSRADLAAERPAGATTPAAKVLDVVASTAGETTALLLVLRAALLLIDKFEPHVKSKLTFVVWFLLVNGSSRLQSGMGQAGRVKQVLNPDWYEGLNKPAWNPPPWAFPLAWIPLKLLQVVAGGLVWGSLEGKVLSAPIVLFVLHLSLGDVWNVQFFLKQRPTTGLLVIAAFWLVLVAAALSMAAVNPLAGALVAPTVAWVAIAACLNLDIWWLNPGVERQ